MDKRYDVGTGLPVDRSYLECGLPEYLQESLELMKRSWEIVDSGEQTCTGTAGSATSRRISIPPRWTG